MFQHHPEILQESGRVRRARDMDDANWERLLASGRESPPQPAIRWLAVAAVAILPLALVTVSLLVVR